MADKQYPSMLALDGKARFIFAAADEGEEKKRPTFELDAYRGGPMSVANWMDPIVIDLEGLSVPKQSMPVRLGHDPRRMVGHTDTVTVDSEVKATGVVSFENQSARDVVAAAKNGFPWQVSVGVEAHVVDFVDEGSTATINGKEVSGPVDIIRKGTLKEISFVDLGADSSTAGKVAAKHKQEQTMTDKTDKTEEKPDEKKVEAAAPTRSEAPADTDAVIQAARKERARREEIVSMVQDAIDRPGSDLDALEKISTEAINGKWTVQETELAILRASRARTPSIHSVKEEQVTDQVLAAATLMSLGRSHEKIAKDPDFGERTAEAAYKRRGITLHGLIAEALRAEGKTPPHGGHALFQAAVQQSSIRAGFSTVDLSGILGTVGNKLLLDSFTAIDAVYPRIAKQSDYNNFLTHTKYRLNDVGTFSQVGQDGEIKHGHLSEDSYTNKLETSGQMLTLTRQQIINDDLGALEQMTALLGRKAGLAVEKATINNVMESADSFYTSAQGNLNAGSALAIDTLAAAEASLATQLDADSEPIYAAPRILLVPPGLKYLAQMIFTSTQLKGDTDEPVDNPFRGRFQVESSPYMAISSLDGSSASTWYLLADPNMLPAFEVAYLRGMRAPTIETADSTFNTLGMQMRVYFDFGTAQVDYRGAIKNTS